MAARPANQGARSISAGRKGLDFSHHEYGGHLNGEHQDLWGPCLAGLSGSDELSFATRIPHRSLCSPDWDTVVRLSHRPSPPVT
jgi:hypothetical protein